MLYYFRISRADQSMRPVHLPMVWRGTPIQTTNRANCHNGHGLEESQEPIGDLWLLMTEVIREQCFKATDVQSSVPTAWIEITRFIK